MKFPDSDQFIYKVSNSWVWLLIVWALSGCSVVVGQQAAMTPLPTKELPPPETFVTKIPAAERTAASYLNAWMDEDYEKMYGLLANSSRDELPLDEFTRSYQEFAAEVTLVGLNYNIVEKTSTHEKAEVVYQIEFQTSIIGQITRETRMQLVQDLGQWGIIWDGSLIMPELAGGNYLRMDRATPARGNIFDRNGNPLAVQADAVALGVWPDFVDLSDEQTIKGLVPLLSGLSGYRTDTIQTLIGNAQPGAYLPLGEIPADLDPYRLDLLSRWNAAVTAQYSSRYYYGNGIAPHVIGYISSIQESELEEYRRKGYRSDEKVGRKGLELWGEELLTGNKGGTLYVFDKEGKPVQELGSVPSQPSQDIYTTIDREFQSGVQKAMSVFSGAIVVLEKDSGRVLAMASSPGFDPNAFQTENYNWNTLLTEIIDDPRNPQFNRASQGQYPLGSVFKLVTIAAALESGRYTPSTQYECNYVFEELPGFPRYDWTYDHFQEDGITRPSGLLTLPEGLVRSCNPFFWHIGLDLYDQGLTTAISEMARSFGLGSPTGIEGLEEEAGNIPDPASQVDSINLAIGQGDMTVTPLQVAAFTAALGNGGTLYRPQIIERITDSSGGNTFSFTPEVNGTLPISLANLKVIQDAMVGVVRSERPLGTAFLPIRGLDIQVAGKTGTATMPDGEPSAWFAGYTFEGREDRPDIAVAVIAENTGEGSEFAAPIFRRVIELYFFGKPLRVYRWESIFDVTRSPTPIVTFTATPNSNLSPSP